MAVLNGKEVDIMAIVITNGEDEVENLQICCYQCNQMKGSILPVDLFQKVTEIFMYQTEKKTTHSLKWKIVHRLLQSCIK